MKSCLQSLLMHKFRSFLSMLGVMIGAASLITMLSIGEGTKQESLAQIESLGLHNIFVKSTGRKGLEGLQSVPGITHVAPLLPVNKSVSGAIKEIRPEIVMTTSSLQPILNLETRQGRFLCAIDHQNHLQVCVIGADISRQLGPKGVVGQLLRLGDSEYVIVGVIAGTQPAKSKGKALSSRDYNQTILIPFDSGLPSELIFKVEKASHITGITSILRHTLANREDVQLIVPQELLRQSQKTQKMFNLVLGLIAAASLLVGGIGIANVMVASVYERTREIGIRRAVGATEQDILQQFLMESLLLTMAGGFMGIIMGAFFSLLVGVFSGWTTVVSLWSIFLAFAMAVIVGVCSGIYPARQAAKMDPITALR